MRAQAFVAALTAYRQNRGRDEAAVRRHEAAARALLTPRLSAATADLEGLGVYADAGPGDEDGWPEPIRGRGNADRYVLTVAFDSDAGEATHGAAGPGAQATRVMELEFARVDGKWGLDAFRRVGGVPQQEAADDGPPAEVAPTPAP